MRVNIERLTKCEGAGGGRLLTICYSFADSPFGSIFVASTMKGVCRMEFAHCGEECLREMQKVFPKSTYINRCDDMQKTALRVFSEKCTDDYDINLNIWGTDFQLRVWSALLRIPLGSTATYADIAADINNAKACRAVGNAVGRNPVAVIIPCHRVIKSDGDAGGYHWGAERKKALLQWEKNMTHKGNTII